MGDSKGYVLLHRKFFDHLLWKDTRAFSRAEAWLDIIGSLAWGVDDGPYRRGEFVASLNYLAGRWRWDRSRVQRFINYLVDEEMIMRIPDPIRTERARYQLVNYEKYQSVASDSADYRTSVIGETFREPPTDTLTDTGKALNRKLFEDAADTSTDTATDTHIKESKKKEKYKKGNLKQSGAEEPRRVPLRAHIQATTPGLLTDQSDWIAFEKMLKDSRSLPGFDLENLKSGWNRFLASKDPFHRKQGHPLRWFCSNPNAFINSNGRDRHDITSPPDHGEWDSFVTKPGDDVDE